MARRIFDVPIGLYLGGGRRGRGHAGEVAPVALVGLHAACGEWGALLGTDRVVTAGPELERQARTTFRAAQPPAALVRASSREQVPEIVRIAARHGVAVYAVSTGKSWGWGDSCPVGGGQVVLDLSGLDGIVTLDEELGYVAVEPGVTQGALADRLAPTEWVADCTAAGPETSVLGNIVERGIGLTAFSDRFANVAGFEVVLADGSVVRTGYGHFGGTGAGKALRWGVGPSVDGLFTQSSYGIVTEVGLWLTPRPEVAEAWLCTVADADLERVIDRLRELRLRGALSGAPHVFRVRGLDESWRWFVVSSIVGSEDVAAAARRSAAAAIGDFGIIDGFGEEQLAEPAFVAETLRGLQLPDNPIFREYMAASGAFARANPRQLSREFLRAYVGGAAQGELPPPASTDLLEEGYGLYFLWSACAATGREVRRLIETMVPVFERHELPPLLEVTLATPRGAVAVTRVGFDRSDPDSSERGEACYLELFDATIAAGFPPARCTTVAMDRLDRDGSSYWSLVRRLKQALDPDGVIAPGRYVPSPPA